MAYDIWNPWHGCRRYSPGCMHCYVFRRDDSIGKDASKVVKTKSFDLPLWRRKDGKFRIPSGSGLYTCMSSDFFIEEADGWRPDVWRMIRQRSDIEFFIITKRIVRFSECIPLDWGNGYDNVSVCCTVENKEQADIRLPVFLKLPIKKKSIICEPLLGRIDMERYLSDEISGVTVGGESGPGARVCDHEWVMDIRRQCITKGVSFYFKQTGANYRKGERVFSVPRRLQHIQAKKAGINFEPEK